MKSIDGDFSHVKTSNLYHVGVPAAYVSRKYSKLFDYLTTRRYMIPLGLYRSTKVDFRSFKDDEEKRRKNPKQDKQDTSDEKEIKYVVTNPPKNMRLRENDLVFVLSQQDPGAPDTWDDYKYFSESKDNKNSKKETTEDKQKVSNEVIDNHETQKPMEPTIGQKQMREDFEKETD